MKIFDKKDKSTKGFGYWGDYGEIDLGFSSGLIEDSASFLGEPLHFHKKATTFFLVLSGSGVVEVEGKEVEVKEKQLLQIDPGEKYKVLGAKQTPFSWVVISTNKDPKDRMVI